ncbi:outer membrane protein assembly factor BamE [Ferribacterium limneticum]|uniref:outer membrane protein assembly factor BamE n=1 Tax=Ferribacterium limneticum TaxID=76259 RepID=UPI001CFACA66|nr:outer membrane protein assembly factor BamE [Ferribacterium limneticum]UCV28109.1 outer membrane protein assembly factor BamE [Ferribacterium limneticum]UCV32026.1 outer membrane protein assembly factor BamE [Ferribacterium limneticum]
MFRKMLIAAYCALLLIGCAGTPFKWADARQIEAGMTKPEVTAKLGAPTRVATIPNDATRYVWVWVNTMAGSTRTLVVDFDKAGRVIKAPPIPDEFQD